MKQKKNVLLIASLMSALVLTGCASNDELIAQQKNQTDQINTLESKVSTLEAELQKQKDIDGEIYQVIRNLDAVQGELAAQAQQDADNAGMYYTIKQDDTLYSIAKEQGISLDDLLKLNPQIENPKRLLIGDVLNIK
ncbi:MULTISPECIES: LysM domain-containing protein [unclassified Aliivibrio]|uniref:LysM peptidoglycan-binding domain-containing protein n=1 Tax=unclassified Aliivibrio TaxID=2645654 RepID=UPI00080EAD62|nr:MULTISPECIES: LysM domain-containing protein [unclassified Aliivibrio]OCH18825.1 peptigoglycan-binding protein LysM [Aliivibrio sp. 1S165]OCH19690.1 peptigoglycan-binding protein LysM [Aliivibrio sp. 1S128]OCH30981.1 peptigoglycan-binding protein LysM [Aliivibrio sp. 1S175]